jgi:hypothetical protein
MEQLREVLTTFGPKKPLKGWTDKVLLKEGDSAQAKLASANIAVNNALDVEYYKAYPRRWPNRSEAAVMKTFNRFYGTMTLYDLTRQWILKDGPFVYDYRWLSENYSQKHADAWANDTFKQIYGVTLDEFEIVQ